MTLAILIPTGGRRGDVLERTLTSLSEHWPAEGPTPAATVIVDDSGDPEYREWLLTLGTWLTMFSGAAVEVVSHPERRGFAAAIDTGWKKLAERFEWVFHLEDDFTFNREIPLAGMLAVLEARPQLVQMSLLRQAVNPAEVAAGGLVAANPGVFTDCTDGTHHWMEQRRYFTTNPSLYRGDLARAPWPQCEHSEGVVTRCLLDMGYVVAGQPYIAPEDVRFGVWGATTDEPWVTHIGVREGMGY